MSIPVLTRVTPYNPANLDGCVLYLPLWKSYLQGTSFLSQDKYGHLCSVTGAVWGSTGRTYAGGDDYISVPAADTELNFTTGAYTLLAWIYPTDLTANNNIFCRGLAITDGYDFLLATNGYLYARTYQSGAQQESDSDAEVCAVDNWYLVAVIRNGASITFNINGVAYAGTGTSHTNPTTSAREGLVGIYADKVSAGFIGVMGEFLACERNLSTAEILHIYNATKGRHV